MRILLKNAAILVADNQLELREILIEEDLIASISLPDTNNSNDVDQVIDCLGHFVSPGLVDVHVHLREPGFEYKETIETGSAAAARGGFTTVCAMPNTNPCPQNTEILDSIQKRIEESAHVRVLPYATITQGLRSEQLVDFKALKEHGAFAFTNDGVGVQTAKVMYEAMFEAAKLDMAIVAHTEEDSLLYDGVMHAGYRAKELGLPGMLALTESTQIARDILLAEATGVHYHVCHVSSKESVRVICDAKRAGINVTAEVSPHHLLLSEDDIPSDSAQWKMNPPLRSRQDRDALLEGLLDGTIDCIATDHAPHSDQEKEGGMVGAPFGIVGSETAFQLLYTELVLNGICTLQQLVDWLSSIPAKLFKLPYGSLQVGSVADIAVFNLNDSYEIDPDQFMSKANNTPFKGKTVYGKTLLTMVNGCVVYRA